MSQECVPQEPTELTFESFWQITQDEWAEHACLTAADQEWLTGPATGSSQRGVHAALAEVYWKGDGVPRCRAKAIGLAYKHVTEEVQSWLAWDDFAQVDELIEECRNGDKNFTLLALSCILDSQAERFFRRSSALLDTAASPSGPARDEARNSGSLRWIWLNEQRR